MTERARPTTVVPEPAAPRPAPSFPPTAVTFAAEASQFRSDVLGSRLADIPSSAYIESMEWEVEYTDEFGDWWLQLLEREQDDIANRVELLIQKGPNLPFPYSSDVRTSRHGRMRELRIQSGGRPLRVFYAFDPRRTSILLIGGDKTGNERFYEEYVPLADALFDEHLQELREEGLT